jgi:hypothetical protein
MKTIVRKLTSIVFLATATFASAQSQQTTRQFNPTEEAELRNMLAAEQRDIASHELRAKDIRNQQPQEKLAASPLCRQAFESAQHGIIQDSSVDPITLIRDLASLMEKSDEVVLAGISLRHDFVFSPSGEGAVGYFDVKIFRSWKGTHEVGDTLTFGVPAGAVHCGMTESGQSVYFSTMAGYYSPAFRTYVWKSNFYSGPYLLFLRHPQGKETQLVQTLLPTGGQGLQGMFPIPLSPTSVEASRCNGALIGSMEWCDSFLETSQNPVVVPYVPDPLAKKYDGMPIADFLNVVRNLAADQGLDEKRP